MFSLYGPKTGRRRRQWTPTTVTASIVAHAAVIAAIAGFAQQAEARTVREEVIAEWKLEDKPKPPPPPSPGAGEMPKSVVDSLKEDALDWRRCCWGEKEPKEAAE